MYYIAVSSIGRINVGEKLYLVEDSDFDEISAIRPSGEVVGYVVSFAIEGCLSKNILSRAIDSDMEMECLVAIKSGDVMILSTNGSCRPFYENTRDEFKLFEQSGHDNSDSLLQARHDATSSQHLR